MSKHRKDDAFFFLVRARVVENDAIITTARKYQSKRVDDYEMKRQNEELAAYFLTTSYMKILEGYV